MAAILHFLLALVVIFALALLVSHDRKHIRPRYIIQLIIVEAALGWFFLHSASGLAFVGAVAASLKHYWVLLHKAQSLFLAA